MGGQRVISRKCVLTSVLGTNISLLRMLIFLTVSCLVDSTKVIALAQTPCGLVVVEVRMSMHTTHHHHTECAQMTSNPNSSQSVARLGALTQTDLNSMIV